MRAQRRSSPSARGSEAPGLTYWVTLPIVAVLVIFVWFISAGRWSVWPKTSIYDYYGSLAVAFQNGHLSLQDEPSPQLLALQDPYRIGARKDTPYIWDASLYQGRYYLYWGPVPALILVPIQAILGVGPIPDIYVTFASISALYVLLCGLVLWIWRWYFSSLPRWTLMLGLLIVGLAPPLTWMLNRPEVYEAAIAAGQFFLLAGLFVACTSLRHAGTSIWRFALASFAWGLAVGSRSNQTVPVIFLLLAAIGALVGLRTRLGSTARFIGALAALIVPVSVAALCLLWYNWARFGNAFEFGYRYQLTLLQMPKHYDGLFSVAYILPNLANYFLNPFVSGTGFPFIRPQYGMEFEGSNAIPAIYFSEAVTGLIYTFPFMFLALVPLLARIRRPRAAAADMDSRPPSPAFTWLQAALAGVCLLEIGMLLVFFFAAERYLADLVPSLALLSMIGFWQGYAFLASHTRARAVLSGLAIALAAFSIITTSLLAVSSAQDRFLRMNPALLQQIDSLLFH